MNKLMTRLYGCLMIGMLLCISCGNSKKTVDNTEQVATVGPEFVADSAYNHCAVQCAFGARVMNSDAHAQCGEWIAAKFRQYGCKVTLQKADLKGYDGTVLHATNIIAAAYPERKSRILVCAHWDSRPWADNDPDSTNWRKPVMAANDGASGVAVMLELARLMQHADSLSLGVDFVCFDAEDWGTPQWSGQQDDADSWALGAQYWSQQMKETGNSKGYRFGILLDMVGGQGAQFYQESMSRKYAANVVDRVWTAAQTVGYGSYFPTAEGGMITDDHIPVNQTAGIPTIDIIPYYPDCQQSSFGPTWHTVSDDMQHIDKSTLHAVGQTIIQTLYSEKK